MLVLSRQRNAEVVLVVPPSEKPTEIVFTLVDIRGDKCRTGWDAPIETTIRRREVQDAIDREQGKAS